MKKVLDHSSVEVERPAAEVVPAFGKQGTDSKNIGQGTPLNTPAISGIGTKNNNKNMKNTTLKNSKWLKVSQLKVGQKIAVLARPGADIEPALSTQGQNDILWDEIVAIKPVGREQVYDIEVEGTHNFVGNDIFAHNTYIGGNVGIGNTAPTAKLQVNDSGEASFVVTSAGFVGIGTTTPAYKLSVAGDIAATAFVNISTRSAKIDIQYLTGDDEKNILEKIKSANVATYHYNAEDPANPRRLGLIAEEAPAEVLSIDGKGVDIYKLSSFILAGVKAQQLQIDNIKGDVAILKATSDMQQVTSNSGSALSLVTNGLSRVFAVAKTYLASIASSMGDWANGVLAEDTKLKVSAENGDSVTFETKAVQSSGENIIASGSATLVMDSDVATGAVFARAKIRFDESFVAAIGDNPEIKVVVTPTTRLNGPLYVAQKTRFGFEVREMNAQDEGGMFDWMVVAKKRGTNAEQTPTNAETINPVAPVTPPSSETPSEPVPPAETVTPPAEEPAAPPAEEVVTPPAEETTPPPAEEPIVTPSESTPVETPSEPITTP